MAGGILLELQRQVTRAPINPLDRATVVSVHPIGLDETKHTLTPSRYIVAPGSYENPACLVVGSASWWREIDETQPLLEIPVSSIQVADAIVRDYCNGIQECDMGDRKPGLFFVPGEFNSITIRTQKKPLLDAAKEKQNNWYKALVNAADTDWARTNGNPLAVSSLMRLAASELGMKDKPWMSTYIAPTRLENCPGCGELINPIYPVCKVCKTVVDRKRFEELGLKFAQ
jgi:hypothetical protein